ncbi:MAG: alanine--tRNA ligase [Flavobacteriaceae bacterium]|nr:alanine--tRNA ligase [Flavobacteriaceae bacterium]|tara:strand:+ start:2883 stop:5507 length:2625 start_codon:yes stop_codon:yes gene_type:complete
MNSNEVRKRFLDFFEKKNHKIGQSSPIVSKHDPSLMFINSGMAPFKDYFLNQENPKNKRVANSQKCLRVSGKHNDLAEVGHDTYHHTFFEMLGNWSFGDYFKEDAINWSWELLTKEFGINPDDLYVTVFKGSKEDGVSQDTEAIEFWNKIIDQDRIILCSKEDNFWEMGDQGPCGPCSEIHVDLRSESEKSKVPAQSLINKDNPLVIELWNLVFIQYNRKASGKLEDLPKKHIDTGMGLERLCMVLQNVKSNYDTDIFKSLIDEIQQTTGIVYGNNEEIDIAMRVISDHLRAVSFSIADGQLPGNTGAGYVIRRILRRAIRYSFTFLNIKEPMLYKLFGSLLLKMGDYYPELKNQKTLIQSVIKEEENSFLRTLDQGLILLNEIIASSKSKLVSGKKAFELYDTYGFPVDLTSLILEEKSFKLDIKSFNQELEKQKDRSRKAGEVSFDDWVVLIDDPVQEFIGYDFLESNIKIVKYRKINSKKDGIIFQLVFNLTPFYAESGGQLGDIGFIESNDGDVVHVLDTVKEGNLSVHITKNLPKKIDHIFRAVVDKKNRFKIQSNHTATHLLHQALRHILGNHVEQKGSRVGPESLRFDFSHFSKLSQDEILKVENYVNTRIENSIILEENRAIPIKKALENGAIGLFGEKYGDVVRTIKFGSSYELCGGTHVNNTSELWQFKIINEGAIASGIRRIEAITYDSVKNYYNSKIDEYNKTKNLLKNPKNLYDSVNSLANENSLLRKEIEILNNEKVKKIKISVIDKLKTISGIKVYSSLIGLKPSKIKDLCFSVGAEVDNIFLILISSENNKIYCSCYISKNLVSDRSLNAAEIIAKLSKVINGRGGGQSFYATCAGDNIEALDKLISTASEIQKRLIT